MYSHLWPDSEDRTRQAVEGTRWNPTRDQGDSLRARTSGDSLRRSAGQGPSGGRVVLEAGDRAGLSAFRGENSGSAPDPRGSPLSLSAPRSRSASSADNLRTAPVSDSGVNANVVDAEQAGRAPAG